MFKRLTVAGFAFAVFAGLYVQAQTVQANATPSADEIRQADAKSEEEWYYSVGLQNYVFTLPLTMLERERKVRLNPAALEKAKKFAPAAPINEIGHMKTLASADDIMPYTPNNDTVYSGAVLELRDEPVILTAPDIADRYWSVEVADVYTNNLFYIGTRATGGKGGSHAFVGPNWKGTLPEGVIEHRVPINTVMFAVRIGVVPQDVDDLKKVNALQDQFNTTSLSNWGDPSKIGKVKVPDIAKRPDYRGDLAYFQTVADLLAENPPLADQEAATILLSRGGIDVGRPMDIDKLDEPARRGLARAAAMGPQIMKWRSSSAARPTRRAGTICAPELMVLTISTAPQGRSKGCSFTTATRPSISAPTKTATLRCWTVPTNTSCISTKTRFRRISSTASGRSRCTGRTFSW
jgi:hypothetical protein